MKKIMFNDQCRQTEAVQYGKKTQTRRIVPESTIRVAQRDATLLGRDFKECIIEHSPYLPNMVIAVAQSYNDIIHDTFTYGGEFKATCEILKSAGLTNKMFVKAELMPHQIEITNIRVERLQDISDEDCLAEGIYKDPFMDYYTFDIEYGEYETPHEAYKALIDKVSGKGTWDSNPWVFVYDFELIK